MARGAAYVVPKSMPTTISRFFAPVVVPPPGYGGGGAVIVV